MSRVMTVDGHDIELSNADKVLFPESGVTKGDLVEYYQRIATVALRHYAGRPLSMHRFPDGIAADGFFQKDAPDHFPDWITRATLQKEGGSVAHVVVDQAATLVFLATQGCITPHLGLSRVDAIDRPDRLIFDLDPSDDDFAKVQAAAAALKALCDALELTTFVQLTGSKGLHIVVPLDRAAGFEDARGFARRLVEHAAAERPDELTVEQRKDKRQGRVFLDFLRNAYGQTAVAPYAVRAIEGAPVATPIDWSEAFAGDLRPRAYTVANIFRRLAQKEDPWADIDRHRHNLASVRDRLDRITGEA